MNNMNNMNNINLNKIMENYDDFCEKKIITIPLQVNIVPHEILFYVLNGNEIKHISLLDITIDEINILIKNKQLYIYELSNKIDNKFKYKLFKEYNNNVNLDIELEFIANIENSNDIEFNNNKNSRLRGNDCNVWFDKIKKIVKKEYKDTKKKWSIRDMIRNKASERIIKIENEKIRVEKFLNFINNENFYNNINIKGKHCRDNIPKKIEEKEELKNSYSFKLYNNMDLQTSTETLIKNNIKFNENDIHNQTEINIKYTLFCCINKVKYYYNYLIESINAINQNNMIVFDNECYFNDTTEKNLIYISDHNRDTLKSDDLIKFSEIYIIKDVFNTSICREKSINNIYKSNGIILAKSKADNKWNIFSTSDDIISNKSNKIKFDINDINKIDENYKKEQFLNDHYINFKKTLSNKNNEIITYDLNLMNEFPMIDDEYDEIQID